MRRCLRSVLLCCLLLLPAMWSLCQTSAPASAPTAKKTAKAQSAKKPASRKTPSAATSATAQKATPAKTAAAPPDVIVLKGAPMGGVKFLHSAHAKDRNIKCETCHHASKPESPAQAAQQRCTDCHTVAVKAPMKTKRQAAFHNPTATAGVCIDCHKRENASGTKAPTKCLECHQKANG